MEGRVRIHRPGVLALLGHYVPPRDRRTRRAKPMNWVLLGGFLCSLSFWVAVVFGIVAAV